MSFKYVPKRGQASYAMSYGAERFALRGKSVQFFLSNGTSFKVFRFNLLLKDSARQSIFFFFQNIVFIINEKIYLI